MALPTKYSTAEEVTEGVSLVGQTWLVTGVNGDLGLETARVLALRGAEIIGAARTETKASAALESAEIPGTPLGFDLSEPHQIQAALATLKTTKLNGVIANAGIMAPPTLRQKFGIELQFLTNHLGHYMLITGLEPMLARTARVVIVSSGAYRMAKRGLELQNLSGEDDYDGWRMYGRSKLANLLFAKGLALQFRGTARAVNAVHPGVIRTGLSRHLINPESAYEGVSHIKSVSQGAATQCLVATQRSKMSGQYYADCKIAKHSKLAKDEQQMHRLMALSEELAEELLER